MSPDGTVPRILSRATSVRPVVRASHPATSPAVPVGDGPPSSGPVAAYGGGRPMNLLRQDLGLRARSTGAARPSFGPAGSPSAEERTSPFPDVSHRLPDSAPSAGSLGRSLGSSLYRHGRSGPRTVSPGSGPVAERTTSSMASPDRSQALDHIVVVLFENRSLDNVLGHLYGPEDGKTFDGVTGKDLTNPIPSWAEHGADRKVVHYTVATDMDSPEPGLGGGVLPHQHPALQQPRRTEPGQDRRRRHRPVERTPARVRHPRWTGSSPTTSAPSPARSVDSPPTPSTPTS